jgi:nitrite reductase (NADH) small subunit
MAEFVKVANKSELPSGQGMVVEVKGHQIALFNANGEFYALDNTCLHRGGPLGEGYVDTNDLTVQCPWHGWIYSLTTGTSLTNPMAKVQKFEVKVEGEDVKVAID